MPTATSPESRYIVRIGDDGRAKFTAGTLAEAREFARDLSSQGWAYKAQIIDRVDGWRESWQNGERL